MKEVVFATARVSRQQSPLCQPVLCRCMCVGSAPWKGSQQCLASAELSARADLM